MATGADVVALARDQIGDPYVWGAEGPAAFDCSGLVEFVARQLGLSTPRTTAQMTGAGSNLIPISRGDLQAGDLIFSNWGGGSGSSHVGIYTGQNSIIEAPQPGKDVVETPLGSGYWSHATEYRRIPGVGGAGGPHGSGSGLLTGLTAGLNAGGLPVPFLAPGNVTQALANIGTAMQNTAMAAAESAKLASTIGKLFLPSNAIRAFALFFGTIFLLIGIFFLAREVRQS